jgi:hypothetical protein
MGVLGLCHSIYWGHPPRLQYTPLVGLVAPVSVFFFYICGAYDHDRFGFLRSLLSRGIGGFLCIVGAFVTTAYMLKISTQFPRLVIGPWIALTILALSCIRSVPAINSSATSLLIPTWDCRSAPWLRMAHPAIPDRYNACLSRAWWLPSKNSAPPESSSAATSATNLASSMCYRCSPTIR